MSMLSSVSDDSFEKDVLQSQSPVLVDFWATWCQPCLRLTPILEEVAGEYNGKVKILKMNIEENEKIPVQYAVQAIPTLIIFKEGKAQGTSKGFLSKTQLSEFLDNHL